MANVNQSSLLDKVRVDFMKKKLYYLFAIIIMIALDQWSKSWIVNNLKGKENIVWIKNVFELEYLENTGAAFSSFLGKQGFLIALTVCILAFCLVKFFQIPEEKRFIWLNIAFSLLISGAVGNMIDRIKQGFVVDFFYFVPINFPRFNVADIYITVSVPLLFILLFFVYKDDEVEFLFKFKK